MMRPDEMKGEVFVGVDAHNRVARNFEGIYANAIIVYLDEMVNNRDCSDQRYMYTPNSLFHSCCTWIKAVDTK
jgi:hypothetical protein